MVVRENHEDEGKLVRKGLETCVSQVRLLFRALVLHFHSILPSDLVKTFIGVGLHQHSKGIEPSSPGISMPVIVGGLKARDQVRSPTVLGRRGSEMAV